MRSIGVGKLRQDASQYLRLVQAGETIEVTDRGRPIALIVPIPESNYERMIREGRIIPAKNPGGLRNLKPLPPTPGVPLPSVLLEQDRADERF
jgi:prevent-host-death family protein